MIGALIGAGMSAASSIFGGISAAREARRQKRAIEKQKRENEDWYNRRYNEDPTQRAAAQRLLTKTMENIRERNRAAAGTQAVIGGTDESVAQTQAANNEALSDAVSQIAAQGEARKDAIEERYRDNDNNLQAQLNGISAARSQAIGQAVQGVAGAAANIAGAFDGSDDDERKTKAKAGAAATTGAKL